MLGYGIGLRPEYFQLIVDEHPAVDWFEILSENYMGTGGKPLHFLDAVRDRYPLVMHGVSMSLGSSDDLDMDYLKQLKQLADRVQPRWISDHLCWTGVAGHNMHDLMPLPYHEKAIKHVVNRINTVQDFLGRQILIENVSSYLTYTQSEMSEWEFISAIAESADCLILLDVNNIYVSARNHQFDPMQYVRGVPAQRVRQIHLAGHSDYGDYVVDTHDHPVADAVWELYADVIALIGERATMIERDDQYPPFAELLAEMNRARAVAQQALRKSPLKKSDAKLSHLG